MKISAQEKQRIYEILLKENTPLTFKVKKIVDLLEGRVLKYTLSVITEKHDGVYHITVEADIEKETMIALIEKMEFEFKQ